MYGSERSQHSPFRLTAVKTTWMSDLFLNQTAGSIQFKKKDNSMTSFLSPTQAPRCHTRPVEFSTWYSSVNQSLSVDCGAFFFWHGHWRRVLSAAHNYLANHSCHLRHSNIVLRPSKEIWSFFFRPSIQYFSHYFSSLRTSSSSLRAFFFDRSGFTALAHRNKEVARLSHRRVEVVIIIARHDPS